MRLILFAAALLLAAVAAAADNVLLIQTQPDGTFRVWHSEGESGLTDDEVMTLEAMARPGGSEEMATGVGPARAIETADGVMISLPAAKADKALLVDRDGCGHLRVWHAAGTTRLSDDQLTDIVMSALPGGGKRLTLGDHYAKAFITNLGVTVTLWKAPQLKRP